MPFTHPYAHRAFIKFFPTGTGRLVADTLLVDVNIPLREGSPDYDAAKVNDLTTAAVDYAKQVGCNCEFWSVDETAQNRPGTLTPVRPPDLRLDL